MSTLSSTPVYVTCPFWSKVFQQFFTSAAMFSSARSASVISFSLKKSKQISVNISIDHNSNMLWAIPTKLGHNNNQHLPFMSHDLEGSKGHAGVTGLKIWFYYKTFQLQQKASNRDEILAHELSLACAQKLNLKLNSKVIKGHFRVNSKIFSKNHKKSRKGGRIFLLA